MLRRTSILAMPMTPTGARTHAFFAVAFVENLSLKDLAPAYPGSRLSAHDLHVTLPEGGDLFFFGFGAVVFHDVPSARRDEELAALLRHRPGLTTQVVREEFQAVEDPGRGIGVADGLLTVDRLSPPRAGVIALTVAQSAAMEYYEDQVEQLFQRASGLVDRLERTGRVALRTRNLHRFVGEVASTRHEVMAVLHLLDKPDAVWDDPGLDRIYDDLRAEFDLADRFSALEAKTRSVIEALQMVLDVARDRRMFLLELAILLLIAVEIVLSFVR